MNRITPMSCAECANNQDTREGEHVCNTDEDGWKGVDLAGADCREAD